MSKNALKDVQEIARDFKSNPLASGSDREIHAPPPQNRRSASRVQNWGWCVFCLFLGSDNSHTTPPQKIPSDWEGFLWVAVPYQKAFRGKSPSFLHFNGAVCSNTLFSSTSAFINLCYSGQILHAKLFEHLVFCRTLLGSIFGALLLEQTLVGTFAAFP